eukprot:5807725-Amphidinium_carterae.1
MQGDARSGCQEKAWWDMDLHVCSHEVSIITNAEDDDNILVLVSVALGVAVALAALTCGAVTCGYSCVVILIATRWAQQQMPPQQMQINYVAAQPSPLREGGYAEDGWARILINVELVFSFHFLGMCAFP